MSPDKNLIGSYFCINPDTTCDWKDAFGMCDSFRITYRVYLVISPITGEVVEGMNVLRKMISMTISNHKTTSCSKGCVHPKDHFAIVRSGIVGGP